MSNVLASEANVATRHELFSTCCLRKDGKCRDTTRHALKKTALTTNDRSIPEEAYSRQKKIKSGPGRVLGLAYVCMSSEGRHRSGACRVDCHDLSRLSWPIVAEDRFGGKYHDMSRNVAQVSSSGRQMSRHVVDILVRGGKANVEKNVTTSRDRASWGGFASSSGRGGQLGGWSRWRRRQSLVGVRPLARVRACAAAALRRSAREPPPRARPREPCASAPL